MRISQLLYKRRNKKTRMDISKNIIETKFNFRGPIIHPIQDALKKTDFKTVLLNPIKGAENNLEVSLSQRISNYGNNVGNMLFVEAMKEQLNYDREIYPGPQRGTSLDHCSMIMPSSNFIIRGDSLFIEKAQQLLDTTKGLCTVAGLGAQSNSSDDTPKKLVKDLPAYKVKFFKTLSERAVSIGVRGEFTAACLEEMGIYNYRIIGCPSAYATFDGKFDIKKPTNEHCIMTVTGMNPMESRILELGIRENAHWIMQMATERPEVIYENKDILDQDYDQTFPNIKVTKQELINYMRMNGHMFFRYSDWCNFYREYNATFSYGSRFHGNMCAMRNGIPALWITHDSRTSELVNTLHLPNINYAQFKNISSLEELISYCNYSEFKKNYRTLSENYVQFLNENGIDHKFKIDFINE